MTFAKLNARLVLSLAIVLATFVAIGIACTSEPEPTSTPVPAPTATPVPEPTSTPVPEPTSTPEPEPTPATEIEGDDAEDEPTIEYVMKGIEFVESEGVDDARTIEYVMKGIEFVEREGLDAAIEHYTSDDSIEDGRWLRIIDTDTGVLVASPLQYEVGLKIGGRGASNLSGTIAAATEEGQWTESLADHPETSQHLPKRNVWIRRGNLVFNSGHFVLQQNIEAPVRNYVKHAVELYETEGLQATIDYYNSQDSLEGTLYLFLIGADDLYLAHPIFPHLIGTDIKDVVGSDGQELGKEIAEATEDGIWVEYLWPNPITRNEEHKTTWALRHDGLIFASGYYSAGDDPVDQPWVDADPRDYTVEYVENAIALYERDGLDAMLDFYNSVASFQGQWYLFATDENDIYHVHPLIPQLRGTDIKDVVGTNGYELGNEIAKATEEGHWIEYLWPHPATLKEVPKVSYAVRRDGMIFASGYYPPQQDAQETAVNYVQRAIDKYESEGIDAVVSYYNSNESIEGVFRLVVVDENDSVLVSPLFEHLRGRNARVLAAHPALRDWATNTLKTTEKGHWFSVDAVSADGSQSGLTNNYWSIRHDGLIFQTAYSE